ncbi:PREDICTED: CD48 antigen isoform X2 [Propithecus coquereli]|uniref:CD48 antigen n=1 Tax=Propithecus coquereli TaxID=379532 RepID=A0A2K6EJJ4_PROCO|nr:PREDICTED: CD48 antigen isoform X2 [Propithecus coquereli]
MSLRRWEWCLAAELLLLPLLLLATNTQDHLTSAMTVVSGSNVSLQISEGLPDNYEQLTWFYTIDQKIVEWDSGKSKYFDSKFKGRVMLDPQSGALNIYNVQKEDSSTYLMRVSNATGKEQEWKVLLEVLDPVRAPVIKIEKTEETNNICYLKLSCVISDQSVNCTWYGDSGPFSEACQNSALELRVPEPQKYSKFYTCQVSNPVSSKNDTVYFTPPCTLARSSGVDWIASWLVVIVPTILGLLLI